MRDFQVGKPGFHSVDLAPDIDTPYAGAESVCQVEVVPPLPCRVRHLCQDQHSLPLMCRQLIANHGATSEGVVTLKKLNALHRSRVSGTQLPAPGPAYLVAKFASYFTRKSQLHQGSTGVGKEQGARKLCRFQLNGALLPATQKNQSGRQAGSKGQLRHDPLRALRGTPQIRDRQRRQNLISATILA